MVAARCDHADQYRTKLEPSDIAEAIRDLIVLPSKDGTDASVIVVDLARTAIPRAGCTSASAPPPSLATLLVAVALSLLRRRRTAQRLLRSGDTSAGSAEDIGRAPRPARQRGEMTRRADRHNF